MSLPKRFLYLLLLCSVAIFAALAPATEPVAAVPEHNLLEAFDTAPAATVPPTPPAERLVGIAYTTWHQTDHWRNAWGTPLRGYYRSDDRAAIRQHAEQLANAGVDFIFIDWSNDLGYTFDASHKVPDFDMIEGAAFIIFDEFAKMRAEGRKTPNISIFIGNPMAPDAPKNGQFSAKSLQVWSQFVANPVYRPLVQEYLGKPLLIVYVNTPSPYQNGIPEWKNPRFTVRYMSGFLTEQPSLLGPGLLSKYGYWSWEDRGPQTYPIFAGHPEAMNIVASWRKESAQKPTSGRQNGETFRREWERARKIGPKFALVVSWNEWSRGEQPEANASKDLEPSKEFGTQYLDLLKEEVAKFKRGDG